MKIGFGKAAVSFASVILCSIAASAQRGPVGNWTAPGNDPGHSGWQKSESVLTRDNTAEKFRFLWKIKLGPDGKNGISFSEPLLAPRLINAQGFKDIVFSGGTDTLYAVDSELGTLLWKKQYDVKTSGKGACADTGIKMVMEPPVVINFGARRAPGTPAPVPAPIPAAGARRLGGSAGGGGFTLKAIYVLTADGMLHGQVLTTGADYGPPVKFLPAGSAGNSGLNLLSKTVYTSVGNGCASVPNGIWSMDMTTAEYPVVGYQTGKISPLGISGPTVSDNVAYVVMGSGTSDAASGVYANSVVAVASKETKAKDWYTPSTGKLFNVTPVAFTYKQKKLIAAPGADGSLVLLDTESLGGADHQTPLAQTAKISTAKADTWDSLATWQDTDGTAWILASVTGALGPAAKFATSNGPATHGSIVAFKVGEDAGKPTLTPAWTSQDLVNPAAPRIANGVVIALSQGTASTPAKLFVLDGRTGKELYNSGDSIKGYAHATGVSIGDSHVFFTTQDNTLYSFGIGIEH